MRTQLFFTTYPISSPLPCSHNFSWLNQQSQEGRKEKPGTLWSGRWLWFLNKSVQVSSDSQMVQQMLSLMKSDKGQFQAPHKTHEPRASAGIAGVLVHAHFSGSRSFSWRAAHVPQNICNGLTLLFQPWMGLAQDKRGANPSTAPSPLTMHQGWPREVLRASSAQGHQEAQEETHISSRVTLCVSAWLHTDFASWETALVQSGLNAQRDKIGWIKFALYLGLLGEPHKWCTNPQIRKLNHYGILEIFFPL